MKKTHKIIISFLIIAIVGTIVIPTLDILSEELGLNSNIIFNLLAKLADSTVVNASGDYKYGGNLTVMSSVPGSRFSYEYNEEENKGFHFYTSGFCRIDDEENRFSVIPEYSINGAEFVQSITQQGSVSLNLDKDVNTLVARLPDTKEIIYKAMIVKCKDSFIVFQNSVCTRLEFSTGDRIYYVNEDGITEDRYDLEYSMDNGETFNKLKVQEMWFYVFPVEGGTLFNNKIIIREKDTQNIIYETPTLGDIEEDIIYENGKTTVKLKTNGTQNQNNIEFSYEKDGQEAGGNEIELAENANIILRAKANIEFSEKVIEKEVQVKVIKTEKPTIEIDDENNLEITQGNVENDEIEKIYYTIDGGEPMVYTEKTTLNLEPGEHTIKAYQVTFEGIESEMSEENITIEENESEEENKDEQSEEEKDDKTEPEKEDSSENDEKEDSSNKENKEKAKDDKKEDTNKEEKNNSSKENAVAKKEKDNKSNKVVPQTGDKVIIFAVIVMGIVILNVVMNSKKK